MDTIEKLVDLLETQEPECVVTVNTGYTYEDDEGQDVEYACDVTLYWGGTSADWDYYINVAGLSEDEEIALYDMMEDKMSWYDPKQSGYTITIEHY